MTNQQTKKPANLGTSKPSATSEPKQALYNYRNLDVWQSAQEIAAEIIQLLRRLPRDAAVDEITHQLIRAAGSVGANVAEGHGRYTFGAYRNHLSIAKGSACETDGWLDLLRRINAISEQQEATLHSRLTSLVAVLTRKITNLEARAKQAGYRAREEPGVYYVDDPPIPE
jgi:four helix bundle protein